MTPVLFQGLSLDSTDNAITLVECFDNDIQKSNSFFSARILGQDESCLIKQFKDKLKERDRFLMLHSHTTTKIY